MNEKPVERLSRELAIEIAESLHAIPDAPRFSGALKATVRDLQDWCEGTTAATYGEPLRWTPAMQARWLEAEARRECQVWPGPAGLRRIFNAKFRPDFKLFEAAPPKPPVKCEMCNDTGVVDGSVGVRRKIFWCTCDQAIWLQINVPNYLSLCNQREATQEAPTRSAPPSKKSKPSSSGRSRTERSDQNDGPYHSCNFSAT